MSFLTKLLRLLHLSAATEPSHDPEPSPDAPVKRGRGRPKVDGSKPKVRRRRRRTTRRRTKPSVDGAAVKPARRRRRATRRATGTRKPRAAAVAVAEPAPAVAPPEPSTALVAASKGELVPFKAKPITAEAFFDLAQEAKRNATDALGARWDLAEGQSHHLMVPSCYRKFKTKIGTRIKISGDRRYPVAEYWPGGVLPPLVLTVPEYRWAKSRWVRGNVPQERWLTYDGPELELTPEGYVDDERAALAEAAD